MREVGPRVFAAILLLWTTTAGAQDHEESKVRVPPDYLSGAEARAAELYREVLPSVVTITTAQVVVTPRGRLQSEGLGSGVVVSAEGHVLTAAHVVDGADRIEVTTYDGAAYAAEVLYSEASADIALVRILRPPSDLQHATLGDSDRLAVGQQAFAIGSPYGLENSFSVGHISGFREFGLLYDGTILAEFIQTDAAINSGNSGGPLFNTRGEVIGIASQILTVSGGFQGIGLVVAINTAKQLLALEDRAWIGIEGIYLTGQQLAQLLNIDVEGGILVQRVTGGSPADKAGLEGGTIPAKVLDLEIRLGGDLILQMGDQEACHAVCLARAHERVTDSDTVLVKFLRGGKVMEVVVDVSETRRNLLR